MEIFIIFNEPIIILYYSCQVVCQLNFYICQLILKTCQPFFYSIPVMAKKKHSAENFCGVFCISLINCFDYSATSETTPEPTVLPPSRIAKRSPFSIAIGVISSTSIFTLSPGIHISVPAGSWITPVTSVVLK